MFKTFLLLSLYYFLNLHIKNGPINLFPQKVTFTSKNAIAKIFCHQNHILNFKHKTQNILRCLSFDMLEGIFIDFKEFPRFNPNRAKVFNIWSPNIKRKIFTKVLKNLSMQQS